jgi:hypothetical protein
MLRAVPITMGMGLARTQTTVAWTVSRARVPAVPFNVEIAMPTGTVLP